MEPIINRLPDELLNKIFELDVTSSTNGFQITVSNVCHRWRRIALQNPLLWNCIYFKPGPEAQQRTKRHLDLSGSSPLDVHISMVNTDHPTSSEDGLKFLELLKAETHRWRSIHIRIPWSLAVQMSPPWRDEAPMLEHLSIHITSTSLAGDHSTPVPLPSNADQLHVINVGYYPLPWDNWTCQSVTELSLGPFDLIRPGPTAQQLSTILASLSQQLRSLSLRGRWQGLPEDDEFNGPVTLNALMSLTIYASLDEYVMKVIAGCQFPALANLEMQVSFGANSAPAEIQSIFCSSPPRFGAVEYLSIGLIGQPGGTLAQVIQSAFPRLSKVRLLPYTVLEVALVPFISESWPSMSSLILAEAELLHVRKLIGDRSDKSFKNLQSLHLEVARGPTYKDDYDFIKSRVDKFSIRWVRPTAGWVYPALASKRSLRRFNEADLIRSDFAKASRPAMLFQPRVVRQL